MRTSTSPTSTRRPLRHLYATSIIKDLTIGRSHDHRRAGGRDHQGDLIEGRHRGGGQAGGAGEDGPLLQAEHGRRVDHCGTDRVQQPEQQRHHAKSVTAERSPSAIWWPSGRTSAAFTSPRTPSIPGVKASADNTARGVYLDSGASSALATAPASALSDGGGRRL